MLDYGMMGYLFTSKELFILCFSVLLYYHSLWVNHYTFTCFWWTKHVVNVKVSHNHRQIWIKRNGVQLAQSTGITEFLQVATNKGGIANSGVFVVHLNLCLLWLGFDSSSFGEIPMCLLNPNVVLKPGHPEIQCRWLSVSQWKVLFWGESEPFSNIPSI